jgi:hypothetical protein
MMGAPSKLWVKWGKLLFFMGSATKKRNDRFCSLSFSIEYAIYGTKSPKVDTNILLPVFVQKFVVAWVEEQLLYLFISLSSLSRFLQLRFTNRFLASGGRIARSLAMRAEFEASMEVFLPKSSQLSLTFFFHCLSPLAACLLRSRTLRRDLHPLRGGAVSTAEMAAKKIVIDVVSDTGKPV